jgi:hypothetical protein
MKDGNKNYQNKNIINNFYFYQLMINFQVKVYVEIVEHLYYIFKIFLIY